MLPFSLTKRPKPAKEKDTEKKEKISRKKRKKEKALSEITDQNVKEINTKE